MPLLAISTSLFMVLLVLGLLLVSAMVFRTLSRVLYRRRYEEMAGADESIIGGSPTGTSPDERTLDPTEPPTGDG